MENDIWIAALTTEHNASCCLLKNGEIVFFIEEERLSRIKAESMPLLAMAKIKEYTDRLDYFVMDNSKRLDNSNVYVRLAIKLGLIQSNSKQIIDPQHFGHHQAHAAGAFFNSGFDEAICVVIDAAGGPVDGGVEIETIFECKQNKITELYKSVGNFNKPSGIGAMYSGLSVTLGHGPLDCGKAMGLSSYGKEDKTIPSIRNLYEHNTKMYSQPYIKDFTKYNTENICYAVQKQVEKEAVDILQFALKRSGMKNIVLTGGFALNCVGNYEYLKYLPEGTNLYVDPVSSDAGLSIGLAKLIYNTKFPSYAKKQKTFYLGPLPDYNFNLPCKEFHSKIVSYTDIVDLLINGNIVAMYQGRSEAGPRALGNRSILFDPRVKDGKDIVNAVKNREWYRPFAGSVLKENAQEWFDMRGMEESPFMMYAVNVLEDKKELIPAIVHVDGTCRVQTVTEEQNLHYYNLIKEFNKVTNVPMLFNTSFNLAGDPLVETMEDALNTLRNSDINYLYLPERNELLCKL